MLQQLRLLTITLALLLSACSEHTNKPSDSDGPPPSALNDDQENNQPSHYTILQTEHIRPGQPMSPLALLSVAQYQVIQRRYLSQLDIDESLYGDNSASRAIQREIQRSSNNKQQPHSQPIARLPSSSPLASSSSLPQHSSSPLTAPSPRPLKLEASTKLTIEEEEEEEQSLTNSALPSWADRSALTGGYSGELSCSYCEKLSYVINLYDDYSYLLKLNSQLNNSNRETFSVGLWSHYQDLLRLETDDEAPLRFRIQYQPTSTNKQPATVALLLLDPGGLVINDHRLVRENTFHSMQASVVRTGLFKPNGHGEGEFIDCLTEQRYRVSGGFDSWRLNKTYRALQIQGEHPILISIRLVIEQSPSTAPPPQQVLAEHLLAATDTILCPYSIL
ncbi:NlpE-like protein [Sinobacterium caligoides]|uniref:NlpE-like protein n=1 Tax=Sinobacterium caligoides TaxID=933926 RepID=A0A3N2DNI2_9GAMM|nr:copper resistance protein NlpE N-terminal domain-containing protein [Sinobacterium caligoides]ROS01209.1 NlpE-like protein [Sinobacterium caligoides]